MQDQKRVLGVFTLAMINVAAIISLRNLSIMVEYGFSSLIFYLIATLFFFLPTALVCAELATGWPKAGGLYRWISEAFGPQVGLIGIWASWMLSVAWFPTVLTFTAGAIAFIIDPELIHHSTYMLTMMLSMFWGITFFNFLGMKSSGWFSSIGAIIGTLIPGLLIIGLGITWLILGKDIHIDFSREALMPDFKISNMVFLAGAVLSLAGMEMSAFHAREAEHPQTDYPKAIFIASIFILSIYFAGSISIALVVHPQDVSLFAGLMQAFREFFTAFNMGFMVPVLAGFAFIGSMAGINTWVIGPAKGILICAEDGFLPPWMHVKNKNDMPVGTLITQAVLGSILATVFYFMPEVNTAFWIVTALTMQLGIIMYILIFASAIKLRYSHPEVLRKYKVPGGNIGMWIIACSGIVMCAFIFVIAFIPPTQLNIGNIWVYESYLVLGFLLLMLPPLLFLKFKQPHWYVGHDD